MVSPWKRRATRPRLAVRILSCVRMVDETSSDEDLYAWFIEAMAREFGAAEEVAPNVIHVMEIDPDGESARDPRPFELHITREQLRSVAFSESNIFDDTQGEVTVPAENPVLAGLDAFTFYTQETMDSGLSRSTRRFVFDGGRMVRAP